jgi:hypothetical protein
MLYIYGAAANASKWQMGFNSAFKGLNKGFTSPPKSSDCMPNILNISSTKHKLQLTVIYRVTSISTLHIYSLVIKNRI